MFETKNAWLEKYEIKKPDYDYIIRECVPTEDARYISSRYDKIGTQWRTKNLQSNRLFRNKSARLMFVGDITCFEKQFEEAKQGDGYDFRYQFEYVKPIFNQADLVVGNLETTIFPEAPYRTEKYVSEQQYHCNAPIEFLDAVRYAGIDVITNANNHDLDTGAVGIGETIDYIENFGFIQTGTFKTDKKRYELIDVNGFKIAIIAFATEHNHKKCNLTKEGIDFLLNDYSKEKAERIVKEAREEGAELVFTCIHWGRENKVLYNNAQRKLAEELANLGVDCIIGSHPHVLQPFTTIKSKGRKVPVFFSMGNFLSHNVNNQKSRSIIACIDLKRCRQGNVDIKCSYVPIFTSKNCGDKKYTVIPISFIAFSKKNIIKKKLIKKVIGNEIKINKNIKFAEYRERSDDKDNDSIINKVLLDLSTIKSYPALYDDGKFVYEIHKEHVKIKKLSIQSNSLSYTIPDKFQELPITSIEEGAFSEHEIMKKINFPKTITRISKEACKNVKHLEGFQLGRNTEIIEESAFSDCTSLTAAVMKNNVKRIESKAFANCTNLRSVKLPSNIEFIADDAFEGCDSTTFYCEKGSYSEQYVKSHRLNIIIMKIY